MQALHQYKIPVFHSEICNIWTHFTVDVNSLIGSIYLSVLVASKTVVCLTMDSVLDLIKDCSVAIVGHSGGACDVKMWLETWPRINHEEFCLPVEFVFVL